MTKTVATDATPSGRPPQAVAPSRNSNRRGYLRSVLSGVRRIRNRARWKAWRIVDANSLKARFLLRQHHNAFSALMPAFNSARVNEELGKYNDGTETSEIMKHDEYVLHYDRRVIIEPRYGWAIIGPGRVLAESLPYTYYLTPPAVRDWLLWHGGSQHLERASCVWSLRGVGEGNYYHCYNDILAKIPLLESVAKEPEPTLVVGKSMYEQPFFAEILDRTQLCRRSWLVQDHDDYVEAERAYFCKTPPISKRWLLALYRMLKPPRPDPNATRRIYLTRGRASGRSLANEDEIAPILERFGFESVDTAAMTVAEQMDLFGGAAHVIGIHGAGMVNLLFRAGASLSVIEVFPPNNVAPHYYWLSAVLGYDYNAIQGKECRPGDATASMTDKIEFRLEPRQLQTAIERMGCS